MFPEWLRELYIYHNLISGYISPVNDEEIGEELEKLGNSLNTFQRMNNRGSMIVQNNIDKRFRDSTRKLIKFSKHLLLPIKDEDNTEFDEEEFFRGSDL